MPGGSGLRTGAGGIAENQKPNSWPEELSDEPFNLVPYRSGSFGGLGHGVGL